MAEFVFLLLTTVVYLLSFFIWRHFNQFETRGIPFVKFSLKEWWQKREDHIFKLYDSVYQNAKTGKHPVMGFFINFTPFILVTDVNLAKNIMIKDFNSFVNRGVFYNPKDDPMGSGLFAMEGERWKNLRTKLTPAFSSGKIKGMFSIMTKITDEFIEVLMKTYESEKDEMFLKNILARLTADMIGTCAFGLDCNSLKNSKAEFVTVGTKIFTSARVFTLKNSFKLQFVTLARMLGCRRFPKAVVDFYAKIVLDTIKYREDNKVEREDFLNNLLKLKKDSGITMDEIVAQSLVFMAAGFETTASTLNYLIYALAMNPEVQEKAREEVIEILKKHNEITYESIIGAEYIEMVLQETLRRYTVASELFRQAEKDYKIPDSDIVLRKGDRLIIPPYSIQMDEEIFPNPKQFDPERFNPEEIKQRTFNFGLTFGDGPRSCIGERFAIVEMKLVLMKFLAEVRVTKSSKTPQELVISNKFSPLATEQNLYLHFQRI